MKMHRKRQTNACTLLCPARFLREPNGPGNKKRAAPYTSRMTGMISGRRLVCFWI